LAEHGRLAGKVAIVTGAGTGIGRACAAEFAREGAKVVLVARRRERLEAVSRQIGVAALAFPADVTRSADIVQIVETAKKHFGGIDVLVNSAAVLIAGTVETLTDEEWQVTFDTNVRAVWQLSRAVLPQMRERGGGSIINLSSVLGLVGARNRAAYAASKGAVTLLTKAMALDHATEGIRVNCICPGIVDTEMVAPFVTNVPDPVSARREREALHPMNRFGRPEEIANLAVYLASDESQWTTGAVFPVDGGYSAR
jgi:NAD(P)-dependent dehydrogenase (short-subunit alcohol dehydrogenase family)